MHQIIQRLKALTLVLDEDKDEAILRIRREGKGPVYARDIQESAGVRVVNPDHLLFTLQDDKDVNCDLYVNKGRGYVESEMHVVDRSMPDFVPSRKELNICGFIPPSFACSSVSP